MVMNVNVNMTNIAGLVVAAGYSSRMGAFKPLLPLGEATVIENTVNSLYRAGIAQIKVVVGHRAAELIPLLERLKVEIIINEAYDRGMYSSIQKGVAAFNPGVEAFFMLPADIPLVRAKTIHDLVAAYRSHQAKVIYPVYQDRRGHPPLISASLKAHILSGNQRSGMMSLLGEYERDALEVEVIDEAIHLDMDDLEGYKKVQEIQLVIGNPSEQECQAILRRYGTAEKIVKHCQVVANFSAQMAVLLNGAGCALDIGLVRAGALLHDIAKGRADHAQAGGKIIRGLDFPKVAEIVEAHMAISWQDGMIGEKEVVFLADKLIKEQRFVTLETRFLEALIKFRQQPQVLTEVQQRLNSAHRIMESVEALLNCSLFSAIEEAI